MPFLASGSLGDRVERTGRLHWSEAVPIAVKVGGALSAAHGAGMVHRDVKPDNILFTSFGEPQLGDFGIARVVGAAPTVSGDITATILYAAPEVLEGRPPSPSSDLYSLAATIVTALSGRAPFLRDTDESMAPLMVRIVTEPASSLRCPDVPDAVWAVIERALAKDPARRQPDLARFFRELQGAQRTLRARSRPSQGWLARRSTRTRP
jgi:serine/threonine-protein kinase PknK